MKKLEAMEVDINTVVAMMPDHKYTKGILDECEKLTIDVISLTSRIQHYSWTNGFQESDGDEEETAEWMARATDIGEQVDTLVAQAKKFYGPDDEVSTAIDDD